MKVVVVMGGGRGIRWEERGNKPSTYAFFSGTPNIGNHKTFKTASPLGDINIILCVRLRKHESSFLG